MKGQVINNFVVSEAFYLFTLNKQKANRNRLVSLACQENDEVAALFHEKIIFFKPCYQPKANRALIRAEKRSTTNSPRANFCF